jgi:hypothetical protein
LKPAPVSPTGPRRPTGRRSRPARFAVAGLAALALGVLTGCNEDNTPTNYGASDGIVRENFLQTCTGKIPEQAGTTILATDATCECAFEVFESRVPYNDDDRPRIGDAYPEDRPTFLDLEDALRGDPERYSDLPEDIRQEIERCRSAGQAGPAAPEVTTPDDQATTTTAPGTTAAPPTS